MKERGHVSGYLSFTEVRRVSFQSNCPSAGYLFNLPPRRRTIKIHIGPSPHYFSNRVYYLLELRSFNRALPFIPQVDVLYYVWDLVSRLEFSSCGSQLLPSEFSVNNKTSTG